MTANPSSGILRTVNPATGRSAGEFPITGPAEIAAAVLRARKALETFASTPLKVRSGLLRTLADMLYQRSDSLAAIISAETGKPLSDSLEADIGAAISVLAYYAGIGPKYLRPRRIQPDRVSLLSGRSHWETYHPRGVMAVISPWNYPLAIPVSGLAAALMTGSTAVFKPSELTPATGLAVAKLFREALAALSLPEDTVQVIIGDGQTGAALVDDAVDGIVFTGSARTGRLIRERASGRGLWSSLELGGSDAMIVLEDCDLEKAASYAVWGRFTNAGQACASVKRLLVPEGRQAAMLALLKDKMSRLRVGPPSDASAHVGPLISETQLVLLEAQVRDALAQGAKLVLGGNRHEGPGWFYAPTLLADIPDNARILHEETFGPVLPVIPYQATDEAIALANHSSFGLTASVFGPPARAREIAGKLACATVVVNDVGASNYAMPCAPWAGWKDSGSGASHGERALYDFSQRQVVSENRFFNLPGLHKPFWHFGSGGHSAGDRARALLALMAGNPQALRPANWLALWRHRASRKL